MVSGFHEFYERYFLRGGFLDSKCRELTSFNDVQCPFGAKSGLLLASGRWV